jgi:hypothetical protein
MNRMVKILVDVNETEYLGSVIFSDEATLNMFRSTNRPNC